MNSFIVSLNVTFTALENIHIILGWQALVIDNWLVSKIMQGDWFKISWVLFFVFSKWTKIFWLLIWSTTEVCLVKRLFFGLIVNCIYTKNICLEVARLQQECKLSKQTELTYCFTKDKDSMVFILLGGFLTVS